MTKLSEDENSNGNITELGLHDVVMGRGAGPNEHTGNVSFRSIVAKYKKSYMATTNRKAKNKIALKAIRAVKANKGRFLQRVKRGKYGDVYTVADEVAVLEKTKQALRHLDRDKRHGPCASSSTAAESSASVSSSSSSSGQQETTPRPAVQMSEMFPTTSCSSASSKPMTNSTTLPRASVLQNLLSSVRTDIDPPLLPQRRPHENLAGLLDLHAALHKPSVRSLFGGSQFVTPQRQLEPVQQNGLLNTANQSLADSIHMLLKAKQEQQTISQCRPLSSILGSQNLHQQPSSSMLALLAKESLLTTARDSSRDAALPFLLCQYLGSQI